MRRPPVLWAVLAVLLWLTPAGCRATPTAPLTVLAASSLTDAFGETATAFAAAGGEPVQFSFAGSQTLRTQIEFGAAADVFASADPEHVAQLAAQGLVLADTVTVFAANQLVIALPRANPGGITGFADLARPGVKLVLAAEEVPAGVYARQLLVNLADHPDAGPDFAVRALGNVVSAETNVRQVVTKVQLGEADAGIVYASDITPAVADALTVIPVPPADNVAATYALAVLTASRRPEAARAFVAFVVSAEGQAVLQRWGFTPVDR